MNEILILPDTHGRTFWKEAVKRYPDADTIFLGDYHDPYPDENISTESSLKNFQELLDYCRNHPNCHLLLGNHDLHYLCCFGEACRLDYANSLKIHNLLCDNLYLFSLMEYRTIGNKIVVFSHAPVLKEWLEQVGETNDIPKLTDNLNRLLRSIVKNPWETERKLGFISHYRGGYDPFGSPVWADVREIEDDNIIPTADLSIFAHTRSKAAQITPRWANLDCRRPFLLTPDLHLHLL